MGKKALLLFRMEEKNYFWISPPHWLSELFLILWFLSLVSFCCEQAVLLKVRTKTQENSLSISIFEEAEEVKIWRKWRIQCETSFARPWVVILQPRWMCILSLSFSFVCRQWTIGTLACKVHLLAHMLVPPRDFLFLASWGMVIKNISEIEEV